MRRLHHLVLCLATAFVAAAPGGLLGAAAAADHALGLIVIGITSAMVVSPPATANADSAAMTRSTTDNYIA